MGKAQLKSGYKKSLKRGCSYFEQRAYFVKMLSSLKGRDTKMTVLQRRVNTFGRICRESKVSIGLRMNLI